MATIYDGKKINFPILDLDIPTPQDKELAKKYWDELMPKKIDMPKGKIFVTGTMGEINPSPNFYDLWNFFNPEPHE